MQGGMKYLEVNILVLNLQESDSHSSSMIRTLSFIEGLSKNKVKCHFLNFISSRECKLNNSLFISYQNFQSFKKVKAQNKTNKRSKPNFIKKVIYKYFDVYLLNLFPVLKYFIQTQQKYTHVIGIGDPKASFVPFLFLKHYTKFKSVNRIQIWGDPLFDDITRNWSYFSALAKHWEMKLLSSANLIFYVSPITLEKQKSLFEEFSSKMYLVTPCYDHDLCKQKNVTPEYDVGYCGDYFSNIRDINPALIAIDELNLMSVVVGNSNIKLSGHKKRILFRRINLECVKNIISKIQIHLVILNLYGGQIPGKIYQLAATGRPILIILGQDSLVNNKILKYFSKYKSIFFSQNSVKDIKKELLKIQEQLKCNNFLPISDFDSKIVAKQFLEICSQ